MADEIGPGFTIGTSLIGGSGTGALPGTFATGDAVPTPRGGAVTAADPKSIAVSGS